MVIIGNNSSSHVDFSFIFAGETDWKVLAIDVSDPLADKINGKYCSFSSKLTCRKKYAL